MREKKISFFYIPTPFFVTATLRLYFSASAQGYWTCKECCTISAIRWRAGCI